MPTPQSAKQKRKRCQNCNKLFIPARNVPDQKFCKDACRREFWTHGSAFGPMKAGLHSAIEKRCLQIQRTMKQETHAFYRELLEHRESLATMRALVQKALDRFEGHTHDVREYTDYGTTYMEAGPPNITTVERTKPDARGK